MTAQWEAELRSVIQGAITRMKRSGTTGGSLNCLLQNTRTRELTCPVAWFTANYPRIATELMKAKKFEILS